MMSRRVLGILFAAVALGAGLGVVRSAEGYPEPKIVQDTWQMDVTYGEPKMISVGLPGEQGKRLYGYITYTVTNRTGADQLFVPEFLVVTDAGDVIEGNRGVNPAVYRAIAARERNPLMQEPASAVGRLLQGKDQARDSVVIWEIPSHDVDEVRVYFAGLSGETHIVADPAGGEDKVLRKNLMLVYDTPGDASHRSDVPYNLKSASWVVR